jgi:hypothetical protein
MTGPRSKVRLVTFVPFPRAITPHGSVYSLAGSILDAESRSEPTGTTVPLSGWDFDDRQDRANHSDKSRGAASFPEIQFIEFTSVVLGNLHGY